MCRLGCIADDFTGASDAASFLVKGGLKVLLLNGIPDDGDHSLSASAEQTDAVVIALKSRTQATAGAVRDSLHAAEYLLARGAVQIYFKYCSTFDSTRDGNIGPVADALMDLLHSPFSVLCPALPANGRLVVNGDLLVNGVPLHLSPMKDHPLTPMWDCRIKELMAPQSHYPSYVIPRSRMNSGSFLSSETTPCYLIPDYETDEDGKRIAEAFFSLPLLTGGSGLLEHLGRLWSEKLGSRSNPVRSTTEGNALILAGSCSRATLGQIGDYQAKGFPSVKMDPAALLDGSQTADSLWKEALQKGSGGKTVLIYSSDTPEQVKKYQSFGTEKVASLLETTTAEIAKTAVASGYRRIITAGGETSGAVTKALGFSSYFIGNSVAPGVPVMIPCNAPDIRLVLKSGNFGQTDFFSRALKATESGGKNDEQ